MSKHTPTPWKAVERKSYFGVANIWIESEKGYTVCRLEGKKEELVADAEFIVRAVNAHEELLGALKRLVEARQIGLYTQEQLERLIADARQAIANAGGAR